MDAIDTMDTVSEIEKSVGSFHRFLLHLHGKWSRETDEWFGLLELKSYGEEFSAESAKEEALLLCAIGDHRKAVRMPDWYYRNEWVRRTRRENRSAAACKTKS